MGYLNSKRTQFRHSDWFGVDPVTISKLFNQHRMPYKRLNVLTRIPFFCEFGREPCQHAARGITSVNE